MPPRIDVLKKLLLGTAAGTVATLTDTEEAEAIPMFPQIRQKFMQSLINNPEGVPRLFHWSNLPDELLKEGVKPEKFKTLESYKPKGLYFTEEPRKIPGHLSGNYENTEKLIGEKDKYNKSRFFDILKRGFRKTYIHGNLADDTGNVVRATLEPDTKIVTVTKDELKGYHQIYMDLVEKTYPDIHSVKKGTDLNAISYWDIRESGYGGIPPYTEYLNAILDADAVKKVNVDNMEGLSEWIIINPSKLNLFHKNIARLKNETVEQVKLPKNNKDYMKWSERQNELKKANSVDPPFRDDLPGYSEDEISKLYQEIVQGLKSKAGDNWKIGLTGAILGGTAASLMPSNSEAMPLGKLKKLNPKQLEDTIRNTKVYDKLIGQGLSLKDENKIATDYKIVDILKNPANNWRYLIVQDAEGNRKQLPMTKDYINVLAGSLGTKKYLKRFANQGPAGKDQQAEISLAIREVKRANTKDVSKTDFRAWNTMQKEKARQIDPSLVHDYSYVRLEDGTTLYMPKEYAKFLAEKGSLKILKR